MGFEKISNKHIRKAKANALREKVQAQTMRHLQVLERRIAECDVTKNLEEFARLVDVTNAMLVMHNWAQDTPDAFMSVIAAAPENDRIVYWIDMEDIEFLLSDDVDVADRLEFSMEYDELDSLYIGSVMDDRVFACGLFIPLVDKLVWKNKREKAEA